MGNVTLGAEELKGIGKRMRARFSERYESVHEMLRDHPGVFKPKTVYNWLLGKQAPGALGLSNFCSATKSSADYILFGTEPEENPDAVHDSGALLNRIRGGLREQNFPPELINRIIPTEEEATSECVRFWIEVAERTVERDRLAFMSHTAPTAGAEVRKEIVVLKHVLRRLSKHQNPRHRGPPSAQRVASEESGSK